MSGLTNSDRVLLQSLHDKLDVLIHMGRSTDLTLQLQGRGTKELIAMVSKVQTAFDTFKNEIQQEFATYDNAVQARIQQLVDASDDTEAEAAVNDINDARATFKSNLDAKIAALAPAVQQPAPSDGTSTVQNDGSIT